MICPCIWSSPGSRESTHIDSCELNSLEFEQPGLQTPILRKPPGKQTVVERFLRVWNQRPGVGGFQPPVTLGTGHPGFPHLCGDGFCCLAYCSGHPLPGICHWRSHRLVFALQPAGFQTAGGFLHGHTRTGHSVLCQLTKPLIH